MNPVKFFVTGVPQPKGSTRAFMPKGARFPIVTSDNAKVKPWQRAVGLGAVAARGIGEKPTCCDVEVEIAFFLPRPQRLAKKAAPEHISRPDVDKLIRACFDAMTGILWDDDSQVVKIQATKAYGSCDQETGAFITVRPTDLALFTNVQERTEMIQ